jgi:hypothetical protein
MGPAPRLRRENSITEKERVLVAAVLTNGVEQQTQIWESADRPLEFVAADSFPTPWARDKIDAMRTRESGMPEEQV